MRTLYFKTFGARAYVFTLLFPLFLSFNSLAQTKTSKPTGGIWSDASTWVEGAIPGPGDAVTISAGSSVVIRTSTDRTISNGASDPATCSSLTVSGVLTLGSGGGSGSKYLNVSDFVTINSGGVLTNDAVELHRLTVGGNFTNNGTFNPSISPGFIQTTFNGAGDQVIDGTSSTQSFYTFIVNKSGGTLSSSANVTSITALSLALTQGAFIAPASFTSAGNITLEAGTTYTAGANTFLGGNFTNNGATFVYGTGTVTFNGSGTQIIRGAAAEFQFYHVATSNTTTTRSGETVDILTVINGNLLIADGTTFQVTRPLTVEGTTTIGNGTSGKLEITSNNGSKTFVGRVTVSAGGTWDNSIVVGGENARFYNGITNNGTFLAGIGNYNFLVNNQSIEGVLNIPIIDVASGVTLTNNGTFTVSIDLAGEGSLSQGNNAELNIGGAFGIVGFSAAGTNNTVNYTGGAQTVRGVPYVNLGLSGSGTKTLNALTINVSGNLSLGGSVSATTVNNLSIGGNLSLNETSSLTNGVSRTLSVGNILSGTGTLTQSASSILNINGGSSLSSINASATGNTVNYNGASPTIIPGSYNNLFLNQSSGSAILNGNISVAGTLTLNTGNLILGEHNLSLNSSASLSIASPSATRMIIASGAGELRRTFSATGSFVFPIGDNTSTLEYSPVTVNITSAGGFSSAYVGVSVVDAKHPSNASATNFLTRYWNISQSGITSAVATISGAYLPADVNGTESSIKGAQLKGAFNQTSNPWVKYNALASNSLSVSGATLTAGQISAFTGITGADPTVTIGGDVAICSGSSFPLVSSVTGDPTVIYSWSPATGLSAANVANPTATPTETTDYILTITDGNGQSAVSASKKVTVNPSPLAPVATTPVLYCLNATATPLTATGTSLLWYTTSTGGTGSSTAPTPLTTAIGNTSYWVSQTANGCESSRAEIVVTINALPSAPVVTTPVSYCLNATATPLTATGTSLLWYTASTGGTGSSAAPTPLTTAIGNTSYWVSQTTNGCESSRAEVVVTVNALPATPTAIVSAQPTCSVATGTITVNSIISGLFFSLDGTDFTNTTGVFAGLSAGNYSVKTKNASGCISLASSTITVNGQPTTPPAPTVSITAQPTCLVATGIITVASNLTGLTFSIDGSDFTNTTGVFTSLPAGSYTVKAKNADGCISSVSSTLIINDQPATPITPTVSVTAQPTCSVATGTITVTSNLTGLTFSIDGTNFINSTGVFTGLSTGNYTVTAKNEAGCISTPSSSVTINPAVGAPAKPTVSVTAQPTCSESTGTISVTSSIAGLSFSINGSDFTNTTGVFTGLAAGNYTVIAKNEEGCVSASSSITINTQPATPETPVASATAQPTCSTATGTITVSSSITGLSFSINGSDFTNTTGVFTGLATGDYTVTAKNAAGCVSTASSTITINAQPVVPSVSTPSVALCVGATMTLSPSTAGAWISNTPGVATINATSGLVTAVSAGTVTFTFTLTASGCSATTATVTVSPTPEKPVITASNVSTESPTLTSSSNTGNQWFKDNVAIAAATNKTLTVSASGSYSVQVTTNGCVSAVSEPLAIVITGIEQRIISNRSAIYPNPAKENIQIDWSDFASGAEIEVKIYDQVGRLIITKAMAASDNSLDVRSLEQGPYVFLARQNGTLLIQRFIKN